jgi:flagellar L-ring protein precursor FlgH
MTKKAALFLLIVVLSFTFNLGRAFSDSIWNKASASPYTSSMAFKVGDIITVLILETTTAVNKAGTDTAVSDSLSASFDHTLQFLGIAPSNTVKGSGDIKYKGSGSTSRTSNVTAKVAVMVTKIMANGNLVISGDHRVEVNDEIQTIKISGMIRPKDISLANTIFSYQVAAAEVSIKGRGTVGEADQPGWLTRFLNWIF